MLYWIPARVETPRADKSCTVRGTRSDTYAGEQQGRALKTPHKEPRRLTPNTRDARGSERAATGARSALPALTRGCPTGHRVPTDRVRQANPAPGGKARGNRKPTLRRTCIRARYSHLGPPGPSCPSAERQAKNPGDRPQGAREVPSQRQQPRTQHTGAEQSRPGRAVILQAFYLPEPERGPPPPEDSAVPQVQDAPRGNRKAGHSWTRRKQREVPGRKGHIWGLLLASQTREGRGGPPPP